MRYFDAHVHMNITSGPTDGPGPTPEEIDEFGSWLQEHEVGIFNCGLNPRSWTKAREAERIPGVIVGAGLHPWQVHRSFAPGSMRCEEAEAQLMEQLCWKTRYIGEVGLDFGRKTEEQAKRYQVDYFTRICAAAAAAAREMAVPRLLSIHSVCAASTVLDILERTGALNECICIFHWFSGTNDELRRAIRTGCWFSVNRMGLSTGKGREYVKLMPTHRLLTETDGLSYALHPKIVRVARDGLVEAIELIAQARKAEPEEIRELCLENALDLFDGIRNGNAQERLEAMRS